MQRGKGKKRDKKNGASIMGALFFYSAINVLCIHLQSIGYAAHTEEDKKISPVRFAFAFRILYICNRKAAASEIILARIHKILAIIFKILAKI